MRLNANQMLRAHGGTRAVVGVGEMLNSATQWREGRDVRKEGADEWRPHAACTGAVITVPDVLRRVGDVGAPQGEARLDA